MKKTTKPMTQSRRDFCRILGGGALALSMPIPVFAKDDRYFNFAVIADTHIIDTFYTGSEGSDLDSVSIHKSKNRLIEARSVINNPTLAIEQVFIAGDFIHNYPSDQWDFYFENETRIDIAKGLIDGFDMPVHVGLGNHDYDVPDIPLQFTHDLFKQKVGIDPYYAVEHRGWKFVHLSNFLGATMDPTSDDYNTSLGSFGETQLNWLEGQLQESKPTVIFTHFPLPIIKGKEVADYGLYKLLRDHRDTIRMFIAGHLHMWLQFADFFGPLHYCMGSTRYDKNAYFLVRVDTKLDTFSVLNWDNLIWGTYNSTAYEIKK